ncbi:MAG TPA: acireductone synthase [Burkholderiales bacterium]
MIRAILTDIEGTTSSLSFVKDVLFPYARARLPEFVRAHADDPEVRRILADVRREAGAALDDNVLIERMLRWIDEDRKLTPLKALQGLIWEAGYRNGELIGHIYDDANDALHRWHDRGLRLYVFSSGSVKAQKLLFGHTEKGDLQPLFEGYFDTTVGAKRDSAAYRRIADTIGIEPVEILFLSDVTEELDAARAAGMKTYWLVRGVDTPIRDGHRVARRFDEIHLND